MSDDDPTVVRQIKQALKRDRYEGEEKRAPRPMTVTDYMKFLPLVVVAFGGYGAFIENQKDSAANAKEIVRLEAAMKELRDWNIKLGERLREHKDNQH